MKTFTLQDIRNLEPCYDPVKYLPEDWQGTVLDVLAVDSCPAKDRIWVASHLASDKTARLFACACAEESFKLQASVDPRSLEAVRVARAYALGEASQEELSAARSAAESATRSAAWSAAWPAAWSAAWSAARPAARSAAWSAAWSAARSASGARQLEMFRDLIQAYEDKA